VTTLGVLEKLVQWKELKLFLTFKDILAILKSNCSFREFLKRLLNYQLFL
jgi:hypothetical protein